MEKKNQYGCFKFMGMLFCILVCILIFSKETFAEENNYITVSFKNNISSEFLYSDDMMLANANELSGDIAKMAMGLANAAYEYKDISNCFSDMGYLFKPYNYSRQATYANNDFVAYTVGHRNIKGYNVYIVAVRGTTGNCEWFSNFNLGKNDYHKGFKKAADEILHTLDDEVKTDNNIIMLTGHSRGAAVANIVAGELSIDGKLASSDHIFGYTYACPAVKYKLEDSHSNIYNFNNPGDAITMMPLPEWGYRRYGIDINLSLETDIFNNFKQRFNDEENINYAGIQNTDSFVTALKSFASTREDFYKGDNPLIFDFAGWFLGPKDMQTLTEVVLAHQLRTGERISDTVKRLLIKLMWDMMVGNCQYNFNEDYQDELHLLMKMDSALSQTVNMTEEEFDSWKSSQDSLFTEIKNEIEKTINDRKDLVDARNYLDSVIKELAYSYSDIESIFLLYNSTDGKIIPSIWHAHQQSTYILWINSMYYGYEGWMNNTSLKDVDLNNVKDKLKTIGNKCFYDTNIETLTVRDGIECIGDNAFAYCNQLKKITIVDSVKTLGIGAFKECSSLKEITMPASTSYRSKADYEVRPTFYNVDAEKIIFTKGSGKVFVPENNTGSVMEESALTLKEVEFEEGIDEIYAGELKYCQYVTSIKLPGTIKKIGDEAFYNCINWEWELDLPDDLESIGNSAFWNCGKITGKLEFPKKLGEISNAVFEGTGIDELTVQDGIECIGDNAFAYCNQLKKITIVDSVKTLGIGAFKECSSLKEITMPASTSYRSKADYEVRPTFYNVDAEKIIFTKGSGKVFVPENNTGSVMEESALTLKEVEFEEGIDEIYAGELKYCQYVTSIKLPGTIKKIGDKAFYNCSSWKGKLYLSKNLESIGNSAFSGCRNLTNILVSASQTELNANCFDSDTIVALWAPKNSTTETYAASNDIAFKAINYPYLKCNNVEMLTPGQNYQFTATVYTGINKSTDKVIWSIEGATSDDTIINEVGLLSVATHEKAKELTISATYGGETSSVKFAVEVNEHEHTYKYQITKVATCTEMGIGTYTCSICGESYTEEIPALGHDYGDWTIIKEATYTEEGIEEQICSRDSSHTQTRSIPKLKISLSSCKIQISDTAYVYDGAEKKPAVTVLHNDVTLSEGTDYILLYTDNINPGTATVTIEALEASGYTGSVQKKFVIRPAMNDNTVVVQPNAFEGCANLVNVNIRATVIEIGNQAFADCKNLRNIYFFGNCPKLGKDIFKNVKAAAYYPYNDATWTLDKLQNYGGTITWRPWNPETGKPAKRDLSRCELSVNAGTLLYDGKAKTPQVTVKDSGQVIQRNKDYTVSYQNNVNPGTGIVTVRGKGVYEGTLTARFNIGKGNNVVKVSDITKNVSGKTQKAKVNARVYGGARLTYASNSKSVKVDKNGNVTIAKNFVGRAVITVKASETAYYKAASKQFSVTVKPSATSISKATNTAKKKITVIWKKNKTCSGYAIQYSLNKNFRSGVKTIYIGKNSMTKKTLSGLVKGKTYYVRLASYKKAGSTKILSNWSKAKAVKIRK